MTVQALQQVIARVSVYLTEAGVSMTTNHCRTLLSMVDEALAEAEAATGDGNTGIQVSEALLLSGAMDRLAAYFPAMETHLPEPAPPLSRGSIGYPIDG